MTVRGAGFIRNDLPPEALLNACCESVKRGQNLIIFPEGTRTGPGTNPKPQRGFANLALFAKADLQMLTIVCEPPILYKGNPWWRVPVERSRISLTVGERVPIAPFLEHGFNSIGARKLTSFVENYYRRDDKSG
jgi:1-acyl-sn-glycerol-3-phosphate acyltransferase